VDTSRLLPKKRALLLLHPGFEEIEAVTPADLLRRAGVEVVLASLGDALEVEGGRGLVVRADAKLSDLESPSEGFDMLILPGGPGIGTLRGRADALGPVLELVRAFDARGAWIAAICAAPLLLLDAGVAGPLRVTSFPGAAEELRTGVRAYAEERVVLDRNVVTSRGAGSSEEFALALIALLAGAAEAEEVRRRIVART
jgi:4-methyl-5(b-hydroxyethyl)-thiazole monophosphate biosynthesis